MQHEKVNVLKTSIISWCPKGQFKQFRHGLSSFIEALAKNVQDKGVKMKYQTHVEDIIINNDNYEIVTDQYSEQFDGILITTPHQTFMKWFNHDQALNTLTRWILLQLQRLYLHLMKNIENTYNGTGFVIARTSNTNITCTWTSKMAFTTPQGKVLIRAYVGKPGDTVVEDHTDDEIATIARRDLNKMMTFHGDPEFTIVNRLTKACLNITLVILVK